MYFYYIYCYHNWCVNFIPLVKEVYGIREKGSLSGISISCRLRTTKCIAIQNSSSDNSPSRFKSDNCLQTN